MSKARRNNKGARALRERRTDAREWSLNTYAVEQWLRERLDKKLSFEKEQQKEKEV